MALEVSVVIPARNEAAAIGGCVAALARQSVGAAALEVIVVAAGEDETAGAAEGAARGAGFGRFEVVRLERGNKNVALRIGCARAATATVILLDADTELAADAVTELARAVRDGRAHAVHGAATPRYDTWVSRYWELNRQLVKDLRFDGTLSGEVIALRRETLDACSLQALFPELPGAKDDLALGIALRAHGYSIGYAPAARATTLVPWTLGVLGTTMLRSRRATMHLVPLADAARQAAWSAALVLGLPVALVAWRWSAVLAVAALVPLAVHVALLVRGIAALRRLGVGDHRRVLPSFVLLDLLGRAIKVGAFAERLLGRDARRAYRGGRPEELRARRVGGAA